MRNFFSVLATPLMSAYVLLDLLNELSEGREIIVHELGPEFWSFVTSYGEQIFLHILTCLISVRWQIRNSYLPPVFVNNITV